MPYSMREISERTGLAARTLRRYVSLGLLPKPDGPGPAASYDEDVLVKALVMVRLRERGILLEDIRSHVKGWTIADYRKYLDDTDPPSEPAPEPQATPAPSVLEAIEGEPVSSHELPPRTSRSPAASMEPAPAGALPEAHAWNIFPMISGMALMVDVDAPPVVKRLASEILETYGGRRANKKGAS